MKFHPTLQAVIETNTIKRWNPDTRQYLEQECSLCLFCQANMYSTVQSIYCNCSKNLVIKALVSKEVIYSQLYYRLKLNNKLFVNITVNFQDDTTHFIALPNMDIKVAHTKFPFFDELAMCNKLKSYLPFL